MLKHPPVPFLTPLLLANCSQTLEQLPLAPISPQPTTKQTILGNPRL